MLTVVLMTYMTTLHCQAGAILSPWPNMSIECPSTGVLHTPVSLVDYIFAYDDLPFTTSEGGAGMKNMLAVLGASENQVLSYTDDSYNWLSWGVNFTSTSLSDHAGKIVVIQYCHYLFRASCALLFRY